jgi:hypothetical protein
MDFVSCSKSEKEEEEKRDRRNDLSDPDEKKTMKKNKIINFFNSPIFSFFRDPPNGGERTVRSAGRKKVKSASADMISSKSPEHIFKRKTTPTRRKSKNEKSNPNDLDDFVPGPHMFSRLAKSNDLEKLPRCNAEPLINSLYAPDDDNVKFKLGGSPRNKITRVLKLEKLGNSKESSPNNDNHNVKKLKSVTEPVKMFIPDEFVPRYEQYIYNIFTLLSNDNFYDYMINCEDDGKYVMNGMVYYNLATNFFRYCIFSELKNVVGDRFRTESLQMYYLFLFINISYLYEEYYTKKLIKKISPIARKKMNDNDLKTIIGYINCHIKYLPSNIHFLLSTIKNICKPLHLDYESSMLSILYLRIISPILVNNFNKKNMINVTKTIQKRVNGIIDVSGKKDNVVDVCEKKDIVDVEIKNSINFIKKISYTDNNNALYNKLVANKIYIYLHVHLNKFGWLSPEDYDAVKYNMSVLKTFFPNVDRK